MSALVQTRHQQLRHRLNAHQAVRYADAAWLIARTHAYAAVAGVRVEVVLNAAVYAQRTGLAVSDWWAGDTFTGPAGARRRIPIVYLNPALLPTRGDAETVIAHEIMHARWPSYGHRPVAFTRAQQLLDAFGARTA